MSDLGAWQRFQSPHYLHHNQRRQEHLASLGLPLQGRTVLEVGAGIGDHSGFFLDRGCALTLTEGRESNLAIARQRFPEVDARLLDLDAPDPDTPGGFDVVYCYGVLYHLAKPAEALDFLATRCDGVLLLETCVLPTDQDVIQFHHEPREAVENALWGYGCRPSRAWVFRELSQHFAHVYLPTTQPDHPEFPCDWTAPPANPWLVRAVFVASQRPVDSAHLSPRLLDRQERLEAAAG